jgi:hypothetical protein
MLKRERVGTIILAVALAALLLFTACAPGLPVEEQKVVKIGYIAPLTGGPASIMQTGWRNLVDYLKYFEEVGAKRWAFPDWSSHLE